MAERTIREPNRALIGRLERIEGVVRSLALRHPGAVRTAVIADLYGVVNPVVPPTYDEWTPVLSLIIPGGRWIVFAEADIYLQPAGAVAPYVSIRIEPFDLTTGSSLLEDELCDCPSRVWADVIGGNAIWPLHVSADVRHGGQMTVVLQTKDAAATPYEVWRPRIKAIPV
jgi:hypothetical protein